jgi:Chaperone of endosialidase
MATPTPYIERHNGDLIQAEEWNAIQIQARTELQSHDHSGGEQGTQINYNNLANRPTAFEELTVQDLRIGDTLAVNTIHPDQQLHIRGGLQVDVITLGTDGTMYYEFGPSRHKPGLWLKSGPDNNRSIIMMNADTIKIWTPLNEPFIIYDEDDNRPQLRLNNDGNLYVRGHLSQGCSRELKENIQPLSAEEAMMTMERLRPVKYDLKQKKSFRQHLGFIAEDLPDSIASDDRKSIAPSEIVALLTQVVREQQKTIESLQTTVSTLEEDVRHLRMSVMPR